jgi:glycosidase
VTVLYLMPPYPMGEVGRKGIGSPYSIRDFNAVEPEHGTLAELKAFVQRAHALGMRVILDITPNHTSRDHVWTRAHREYYFPEKDGELRYDWDWSDTAKLNYGAPGLRRAMVEALDFWLTVVGSDGVDGFRFDMAHIISDLSFWNEGLAELRARHPQRQLLFMAESYGARNNLDLFARGMNAAYDDDLYKVCQYLYAVDGEGRTVVALSPDAAHNGDFADKLAAFQVGGLAGAVEAALLRYENALSPDPAGPWLARYTDNHDEGRGVCRFGDGGVRAMMQLVFLTAHTLPFLLTGQEFGAANRPSIHARLGQCDKGPRVIEGGTARVRDGVEFEGNLFARGREARQAWYAFYRELIGLRRKRRELTDGTFALLDAGERCAATERTVVAFQRGLHHGLLNMAVNLGPEPRRLTHAALLRGRCVYGRLDGDVLAPFQAVVVEG